MGGLNIGGSSILVIIVLISLITLATLSLLTASNGLGMAREVSSTAHHWAELEATAETRLQAIHEVIQLGGTGMQAQLTQLGVALDNTELTYLALSPDGELGIAMRLTLTNDNDLILLNWDRVLTTPPTFGLDTLPIFQGGQ